MRNPEDSIKFLSELRMRAWESAEYHARNNNDSASEHARRQFDALGDAINVLGARGEVAPQARLSCPDCGVGVLFECVACSATNYPKEQAQPDATFAEWLATEMPTGTVIGNPAWWAKRIARQYAVRCTQARPDGGECDACGDARYTMRPSGPHACWKCAHPAPAPNVARMVEAAKAFPEEPNPYTYRIARAKLREALAPFIAAQREEG